MEKLIRSCLVFITTALLTMNLHAQQESSKSQSDFWSLGVQGSYKDDLSFFRMVYGNAYITPELQYGKHFYKGLSLVSGISFTVKSPKSGYEPSGRLGYMKFELAPEYRLLVGQKSSIIFQAGITFVDVHSNTFNYRGLAGYFGGLAYAYSIAERYQIFVRVSRTISRYHWPHYSPFEGVIPITIGFRYSFK